MGEFKAFQKKITESVSPGNTMGSGAVATKEEKVADVQKRKKEDKTCKKES